ncbi:hypothetical protein KY285_001353 [Solanum tuberosum]|nr:hypothetical protein KY285_001353 [Solanum tuberosum]
MVSTDTIEVADKNRNHPLYLLQSNTPGGDAGATSYTSGGSYSGGDAGASTSTVLYAGRGHQQSSLYKPKKNYNLQCDVCKMKGHTKETCYRVVGYLPDYRFRKKSGNNANRTENANAVENDSLGQTPPTFR